MTSRPTGTSPTGVDNRKRQRSVSSQDIDVYDNTRDVYLGRVVNIHAQGLMVIGDAPFTEDCLYRLDLHLSKPVHQHNSIQLGVDCLWVRNSDDNSKHWAGFTVIDVSPQALADIAELAGESL